VVLRRRKSSSEAARAAAQAFREHGLVCVFRDVYISSKGTVLAKQKSCSK